MTKRTRRDLLRTLGAGSLLAAAGCTAIRDVDADVLVENTGRDEERTSYYVDRGETRTATTTVDLAPGEAHTGSIRVGRGDVAVVTKGELIAEPTLDAFVCRRPTLYVDTGFGALGASWRCG